MKKMMIAILLSCCLFGITNVSAKEKNHEKEEDEVVEEVNVEEDKTGPQKCPRNGCFGPLCWS